jgi:hypothetical protein
MVTPSHYPIWSWTWSAVFAGVFASLVVQILLVLLGLGIGTLVFDAPTANNAPAAAGWAAFVWWAMSGIIAAFVGGMVAGGLSPDDSDWARAGHAIAAWAVTTVIVVGFASITANSAANVFSRLAGPAYSSMAYMDAVSRPARTTTGEAQAARPTQAQVEKARRHFAYAMFASLAALLLGAGAAYGGALSSRQETLRITGATPS